MSALVISTLRRCALATSAQHLSADFWATLGRGCNGPCVDGSGLSRDWARRSAGRSSHVFGLSVRLTGPLAI